MIRVLETTVGKILAISVAVGAVAVPIHFQLEKGRAAQAEAAVIEDEARQILEDFRQRYKSNKSERYRSQARLANRIKAKRPGTPGVRERATSDLAQFVTALDDEEFFEAMTRKLSLELKRQRSRRDSKQPAKQEKVQFQQVLERLADRAWSEP